jgi:hypothetical protein
MVVRFSSGATICIENTITVRFFRSLPQLTKQAFRIFIARNAPTHDADGACREMPLETAGYELSGWAGCVFLRGSSSEISEETPKYRTRSRSAGGQATAAEISTSLIYRAFLPERAARSLVARFLRCEHLPLS